MRSVCVPRPDSSRLWRGRRFCLHIVRRSCFTFSLIGAAAGVFGWRGPARATDYYWITPAGGVFTNSANWKSDTLQPGPGGALDTVNFNQSIPVSNRYTVTGVTGQNLQLSVLDDSLTLDLSGNYTLQDFLTGISAGDTADVILTGSGTLQTTFDGRIGDGTGSVGVVTVDDLQWIDNHALIVGNFGAGTLTVQNGGSVSNTDGTIGFGGVMGDVTVTGTGSTWTNSAELQVGGANHSAGTLTIQSGGSVSSDTAILGRDNGSDGAVNVSGATWSNNGALTVGKFGHGSLIINSNGDVSSAGGTVGFNSQFGGDGFVRVSGSGATWTDNGDLTIGDAGTGSLEIFTGGHVSDINGFVGKQAGSSGTVSIVGATWTNSGSLEVGAAGMGTLNINSRSVVSNTGGFIGNDAGSMGNVNVSGANGKWLNSFGLSVGFHGIGTLDVTAGGFVSSLNGHIGSESGSSGTVTVSVPAPSG